MLALCSPCAQGDSYKGPVFYRANKDELYDVELIQKVCVCVCVCVCLSAFMCEVINSKSCML